MVYYSQGTVNLIILCLLCRCCVHTTPLFKYTANFVASEGIVPVSKPLLFMLKDQPNTFHPILPSITSVLISTSWFRNDIKK